jgi:hypothetical protein
VVAQTGDYTVAQITGAAPLASPTFTGVPAAPTPSAGTNTTQLATTAFVQTAVSASAAGLSVKPSVQEGTTTALPTNTYLAGVITITATGTLTLDGIVVALGDRVLVKNEVTQANNGIYTCTTAGAVGVQAVLTRATDMNTGAQVPGAFVFVEQGTVNAGTGWVVAGEGPYTIGVTAIVFTQFSSSLTTPVSIGNGGTGSTTASAALTALGAMPSTDDLSAIATANPTAANVAMNSHKITSVSNGTANSDAASFGQAAGSAAVTASAGAATVATATRSTLVTNNAASSLAITISTTGATAQQPLIVQILDFSGVAQTLSWVNTENSTVSVPTTSNGSTTLPLTVGFIWNAATSKWRCVAVA